MNKIGYLLIAISFVIGITLGSSTNVIGQSVTIPSWVKNTALWWGQGQISDDEFIKAIQWLISQGILKVPTTSQSSSTNQQTTNPLSSIIPSDNDMQPFWKIVSVDYKLFKWNNDSVPPIATPSYSEVEAIQISSDSPTTSVTISVASFGSGLSQVSLANSVYAYQQLTKYYAAHSSGFTWQAYTPIPNDNKVLCVIYDIKTTQITDVMLYCQKGNDVFSIHATGNAVDMDNEVESLANIIIPRISAF